MYGKKRPWLLETQKIVRIYNLSCKGQRDWKSAIFCLDY